MSLVLQHVNCTDRRQQSLWIVPFLNKDTEKYFISKALRGHLLDIRFQKDIISSTKISDTTSKQAILEMIHL